MRCYSCGVPTDGRIYCDDICYELKTTTEMANTRRQVPKSYGRRRVLKITTKAIKISRLAKTKLGLALEQLRIKEQYRIPDFAYMHNISEHAYDRILRGDDVHENVMKVAKDILTNAESTD